MAHPQSNSRLNIYFLFFLVFSGLTSCGPDEASTEVANAFDGVIPRPASSVRGEGSFRFTGSTVITASQPELDKLSTELIRIITGKTGIIAAKADPDSPDNNRDRDGSIVLAVAE